LTDRRSLALLLTLARGARSSDEVAASLRLVVLWMLLASRLAAAGRNDSFRPPHRMRPAASRRAKGRRLARGSIAGRRPRG
jgi:hypothetical protein